jgi:hypothetical protein
MMNASQRHMIPTTSLGKGAGAFTLGTLNDHDFVVGGSAPIGFVNEEIRERAQKTPSAKLQNRFHHPFT